MAYDGISWQIIKNGAAPPARQLSAMAFDKKEEQLVLFGGWDVNKNLLADTWAWKENTWSKLNIEGPSPRASHAMVYNGDLDAVLVYGGFSPDLLRELWKLKDGKWVNMTTADAPLRGHMAVGYDDSKKRTLVFGGFGNEGRTNELWQYANNHWLQINEGDTSPEPRAEHKGVFIPGRGLFIFGGVIGVDPNTRDRGNDTWLYHDGGWQKLNE